LGAAIGTDYNGRPHLAWLQDTVLLSAVPYPTGFAVIKLDSSPVGPDLGLPCFVCAGPFKINFGIAWPHHNKLIHSYYYSGDTVEIFRDTVHLGSDTIKQITAKDGFVSWKENG
jgi:hypothetical protein